MAFIPRLLGREIILSARLFPAVAMLGPRQVGKTTLARNLEKDLGRPVIHLDLEVAEDLEKLSDARGFLRYYQDYCIVIDEVQRLPELFTTLRPLIDERREAGRFILLGSASPLLIRHSSENLAGRIAYHELSPFALPEVKDLLSMPDHWLRGGFPDVVLNNDPAFQTRWMDNFIRTFTERDLPELGHDVSPQNVSRLWQMLAHHQSGLLNVSELANALGVAAKTVSKYLDLLEGGFMIQRLPAWFANVGKRLVKSPKVYLRDTGILHHLLRIRTYSELTGHPVYGRSWESYVVEQIKRVVESKWEMYFYRTQAGAECDLFLVAPNGKRVCVEIKASNVPTITKGFFQSLQDLKPDLAYVIVPESLPYPKNNVWICGLADFLEKEMDKISR